MTNQDLQIDHKWAYTKYQSKTLHAAYLGRTAFNSPARRGLSGVHQMTGHHCAGLYTRLGPAP